MTHFDVQCTETRSACPEMAVGKRIQPFPSHYLFTKLFVYETQILLPFYALRGVNLNEI